jgi:hypothetical protein
LINPFTLKTYCFPTLVVGDDPIESDPWKGLVENGFITAIIYNSKNGLFKLV